MFSTPSIQLVTRMGQRADKAGGEPFGFDPITLVTLFLSMLPQVMALFAACKKQPPTPPPVPASLSAVGVTEEDWAHANGIKFAASESASGDGFHPLAIRRTAAEIAKAKGIKRKAAKPLAIAALQTARDESAESLAITMSQAKSNATSLGM